MVSGAWGVFDIGGFDYSEKIKRLQFLSRVLMECSRHTVSTCFFAKTLLLSRKVWVAEERDAVGQGSK